MDVFRTPDERFENLPIDRYVTIVEGRGKIETD